MIRGDRDLSPIILGDTVQSEETTMHDLDALLRTAARRLSMSGFLESLVRTGVLGLSLLLVWAILTKFIPQLAVAWWMPVSGIAVLVLVVSMLIGWNLGRDRVSVAVAVDSRLGLEDRFSTAVQVEDRDDPFAVAAVADAARVASDPGIKARVVTAFRPDAPHGWWLASILLVLLVGVWTIIPQVDLFGDEEGAEAVALLEARDQTRAQVEEIIASVQQDGDGALAPEIQKALADLSDSEFAADPDDPEMTPEEVRRDALRRVGSLEQKMQEILDGEEAQLDETLRDSLSDLKAGELEDADARELAEALEAGDFSQALEAFDRLGDKIESGEMTDDEKARLERELEALAEEMERLADDAAALEDALRQAGLDGDLARDPEALQKAMENTSMSESRRKAIEDMINSQSAASETLEKLAKSMQQMAQQGQPGQQQQGEQGQQGAEGQQTLGELEQVQQMLQQARATQGQCQNAGEKMGSGLSQWASNLPAQGEGQGQGQGAGQGKGGFGQRGAGGQGDAPIAPTPSGSVDQRETVENRGGDIIAREMIEGEVVVGESKAALQRIADRIAKGEEEGVGDDPVPPHLRDVHRHYFGEVEKRIRAVTSEKAPKSGEAKPAPSEPASDE